MSRSGYSEDCDDWQLIKYRGQVASAIRGKRGQAFLRDLLEALDAMPEKRLITGELQSGSEVCAIGALGLKRGVNMDALDPEDADIVAATFDIAPQLAREVVYENDEAGYYRNDTPEQLWQRMRAWTVAQIKDRSSTLSQPEEEGK